MKIIILSLYFFFTLLIYERAIFEYQGVVPIFQIDIKLSNYAKF